MPVWIPEYTPREVLFLIGTVLALLTMYYISRTIQAAKRFQNREVPEVRGVQNIEVLLYNTTLTPVSFFKFSFLGFSYFKDGRKFD